MASWEPSRRLVVLLIFKTGNLGKFHRIQAGATDQDAVNVDLIQDGRRVVGLHGTAVEKPCFSSDVLTIEPTEFSTDGGAHLLGIIWTSDFAGAAVAVFLTRSANIVTQSALEWAKKEDTKAVIEEPAGAEPKNAEPENKWELFISSRKVASLRAGHKSELGMKLKGGRLIGPIERLLIVVLAFAGAPQIIAGLAAAKGVVRFPEISEDRTSGSKAEEFLVGSLASWAMAAVAILYLTLVRRS